MWIHFYNDGIGRLTSMEVWESDYVSDYKPIWVKLVKFPKESIFNILEKQLNLFEMVVTKFRGFCENLLPKNPIDSKLKPNLHQGWLWSSTAKFGESFTKQNMWPP